MIKCRRAGYIEALTTFEYPKDTQWTNTQLVFVVSGDNTDEFAEVILWLKEEIGPQNYYLDRRVVTLWVMLKSENDALRFRMRW